ncbi:hypothetical protein CVT26_003730 [Gymnopilus dilepis]|uniref:Peptidase C14 caspase domain-containing protein n=1 Tax=Gymnopilus dilepis TaxID=231916 RepID=A0A409YXH4_9AGAR|nr:hypothetical protein CVT26_003730 [Gymnopilus dilepis]
MSNRIFALLVGVSRYQSPTIANLWSCAEDAKTMRTWLLDNFHVPREHICLLEDRKATRQNMEDTFMRHLVNNSAIERGDAIIFYFAGHGSCLPAPAGWFTCDEPGELVQVICAQDFDSKESLGWNAGISDRSFNALLQDLILVKGDNVTVILDCCFSPSEQRIHKSSVRLSRWTKAMRATSDDLYRGLWVGARGKAYSSKFGFFDPTSSHTVLAASAPALEQRSGGHFTSSFQGAVARLPLHRTSYAQFIDYLGKEVGDLNEFRCTAKMNVGAIHGVTVGTEMSLHLHNHWFSFNPPFAHCTATDVGSTCTSARYNSPTSDIPQSCWAKVVKWNNSPPLRVCLKASLASFLHPTDLAGALSIKSGVGISTSGVKVLRVKRENMAELSLGLHHKILCVEHAKILSHMERNVFEIANKPVAQGIDDATQFRFHLMRRNDKGPLHNLVDLKIYVVGISASIEVRGNGVAIIPYQKGDTYRIKLRNNSSLHLWPYLVYMDPRCHGISVLHSPDVFGEKAPLPSLEVLDIGPEKLQLISSDLFGLRSVKSVYLKLFLSSVPVDLKLLEQNSVLQNLSEESKSPIIFDLPPDETVWDTALASLIFVPRF